MRLTVAICTWNRSQLLRRTLEQMCRLVIPPGVEWELIVVDNNSTDDTRQVVEEFASRLPIRYIFEPKQGLSHARNRAVQEAQGEYILWTDDDVLVCEEWMQAYVEGFQKYPEAAFFGGKIHPWFEDQDGPGWLRKVTVFVERDLGDEILLLPRDDERLPLGANFAVRMDWQRTYAYNPEMGVRATLRMSGEETDVLLRMVRDGAFGVYLPRAQVHHWVAKSRQTPNYLRGHYFWLGYTFAFLYPPKAPRQFLGVPLWAWRAILENSIRYFYNRLTKPPEVWIPALVRASHSWGFWYGCLRRQVGGRKYV